MNTICPKECKLKMNENDNIELIDIREAFEYEFSNIGCKHIPMQTFLDNANDLDPKKTYVLMCKSRTLTKHELQILPQNCSSNRNSCWSIFQLIWASRIH